MCLFLNVWRMFGNMPKYMKNKREEYLSRNIIIISIEYSVHGQYAIKSI